MNIIFKLTYFLIIMTIFNTTYANVEISNHVTKNGIKVLYTRSANIPMIDIKITFDYPLLTSYATYSKASTTEMAFAVINDCLREIKYEKNCLNEY